MHDMHSVPVIASILETIRFFLTCMGSGNTPYPRVQKAARFLGVVKDTSVTNPSFTELGVA
jgi:hypothetical protein